MKQAILSTLLFLCSVLLYAQIGRVGINTTTPAAMLHVKDSSVLFSGPPSIPLQAGPPPATGTGVRMMWYPDKAAFRAGQAIGNQWNKDSIGLYSFAYGYDVRALAENCVAMGYQGRAESMFCFIWVNSTGEWRRSISEMHRVVTGK